MESTWLTGSSFSKPTTRQASKPTPGVSSLNHAISQVKWLEPPTSQVFRPKSWVYCEIHTPQRLWELPIIKEREVVTEFLTAVVHRLLRHRLREKVRQCIWAAMDPSLMKPLSKGRIQDRIEAAIRCVRVKAPAPMRRLLSPSASSSRHSIHKTIKTKSKICWLVLSRFKIRIQTRLIEVVLISALTNKIHLRRNLYLRSKQMFFSFRRRKWAATAITKQSPQWIQTRSSKDQLTMKLTVTSRRRKVLSMYPIEAHPRARFRIIYSRLSRSSNCRRIRWNWAKRFLDSQLPTPWGAWVNQVKVLRVTPVRPSKWSHKQVNLDRLHQTAARWWTAWRICLSKTKLRCWVKTQSQACRSKTCF